MLLLLLPLMLGAAAAVDCPAAPRSPRGPRRRRHLVFPAGSSFQLTGSWADYMDIKSDVLWAIVCEFTAGYPLPATLFEDLPFYSPIKSRKKVDVGHREENTHSGHDYKYDNIYDTQFPSRQQQGSNGHYSEEYLHSHERFRKNINERIEVFRKVEKALIERGADGRACVVRARCEASRPAPHDASFIRHLLQRLFRHPDPERGSDLSASQCDAAMDACPFSLLDPEFEGFW